MNTKNTKVNIPDWIFNPGLDSGDRTGGFTSPATKPNESDVEILIREAIQNSKDKITSNTNILNFNIRFYELTNKDKENFLKKIKWSSLHQHIYNASNESSNLKENNILKEGVKNINSKTKPLRILVLEDNICKGLTGDDEDENGNFNLLTKTDYVTPETSKRGGSYGVGKTKILNCSSIRTLLFSSIPIDNEKRKQNKKDVRLFGRCILPTHKINNKTFHSAGYFGLSDKDNKKAISFYDTNLSKDILVERDLSTTGTTIAVVGFHEPKHSSTNRSIGTIIEDLDHAIQKNYWPILREGLPNNVKLNVRIEHYVNGEIQKNNSRLIDDITKKDFENFSKALINQNNQKNVSTPISSTVVKIPFQIPERVKSGPGIAKHKSFKTELELCIYRSDLTMMHSKFKNMCAFIRGFGMVVKYETTKRKPIDPLPFFAVLKVGNAKSDTEADLNDAEEDFFRLIEPELHNDWVTTDNYQQNFDKKISPNTLIEKLKYDISEKIYELCGFEVSENKNGPQPLSKKLAIGKGSSGKKERGGYKIFSENIIQIPISDGKYDISFDIKRKKGIEGPINVKVDYMLNSESGETKKIPFVELKVSNNNRIIEHDKLPDNQIRFILPTDLDGVLFKGIISPKQLKIDEPEIFESFDFNKIAISSSLLSFENKKVKINE